MSQEARNHHWIRKTNRLSTKVAELTEKVEYGELGMKDSSMNEKDKGRIRASLQENKRLLGNAKHLRRLHESKMPRDKYSGSVLK